MLCRLLESLHQALLMHVLWTLVVGYGSLENLFHVTWSYQGAIMTSVRQLPHTVASWSRSPAEQ
jgi:hypothetical protein